jgi:hypothetical protein
MVTKVCSTCNLQERLINMADINPHTLPEAETF